MKKWFYDNLKPKDKPLTDAELRRNRILFGIAFVVVVVLLILNQQGV